MKRLQPKCENCSRKHVFQESPIGIIGFGHMGQALAHAFAAAKFKQIFVSDNTREKFLLYKKKHRDCCGGKVKPIFSNGKLVEKSKIVILAVRPPDAGSVLLEINKSFSTQILISIVAGISLGFLKKYCPRAEKIVRVMPNLAAQIRHSVSVWKSLNLIAKEKEIVKKVLNSFGKEIEIKNEDLINVATAVSGSGPAYVFEFLNVLQKSAMSFGFGKTQARELALQTVFGSARFAGKSGDEFENLAKQVQTKGGTTEAAFKILTKKKWGKILEQAIKNAYKKARFLGK